jgi:hypothetical protein
MKNKDMTTKRYTGLIVLVLAGVFSLALGLLLRPWFSERIVTAAKASQPQETGQAKADSSIDVSNQSEMVHNQKADSSSEPVKNIEITQRVNNIEITVDHFRREKDQVLLDVCFQLPDNSDWLMWNGLLKYGKEVYEWSGGGPFEIRLPPENGKQRVFTFPEGGGIKDTWEDAVDGQIGRRCETVYFDNIPLAANQTHFTFTIDAIEAAPREGEECTRAYLDKWQTALDARKTGIRIKCIEEEYISGLEIADKPASMSMEDAKTIIHSMDLYLDVNGIRGPWIFEFDIK